MSSRRRFNFVDDNKQTSVPQPQLLLSLGVPSGTYLISGLNVSFHQNSVFKSETYLLGSYAILSICNDSLLVSSNNFYKHVMQFHLHCEENASKTKRNRAPNWILLGVGRPQFYASPTQEKAILQKRGTAPVQEGFI